MSLTLVTAIAAGVIKCPSCSQPITKTEDHNDDEVYIPQIGGSDIPFLRSEEMTREKCGHKERTDNWKKFVTP